MSRHDVKGGDLIKHYETFACVDREYGILIPTSVGWTREAARRWRRRHNAGKVVRVRIEVLKDARG